MNPDELDWEELPPAIDLVQRHWDTIHTYLSVVRVDYIAVARSGSTCSTFSTKKFARPHYHLEYGDAGLTDDGLYFLIYDNREELHEAFERLAYDAVFNHFHGGLDLSQTPIPVRVWRDEEDNTSEYLDIPILVKDRQK